MRLSIDKRVWPGFWLLAAATAFLVLMISEPGVLLFGGFVIALHLAFFRDPVRDPEGEGALSPADGKVVEVTRVPESRYLREDAVRIGIFLSVLDVHVNRAPWRGEVDFIEYRPGKFLNALRADSLEHNESNWVGFKDNGRKFLIRQISGTLARRIHCDVRTGQKVERAEKVGIICYGSRVECYFPAKLFEPRVRPGDRVETGKHVIGVWKE